MIKCVSLVYITHRGFEALVRYYHYRVFKIVACAAVKNTRFMIQTAYYEEEKKSEML